MVSQERIDKALEFQSELLRRLDSGPGICPVAGPRAIMSKIKASDQSLLSMAFGEFGICLGRFVKSLDLSHPESISICDAIFGTDHFFADKFYDLLMLAEIAAERGHTSCFPFLGQAVIREYMSKPVYKRIETGQTARSYVRVVEDRQQRGSLRKGKRTQIIDMQSLYKKGDEVWSAQPEDFGRFMRFDSAYRSELEQAEKRMLRYRDMRCSTLAQEMQRSINSFRENMDQSYYGFNRITMTNAAVVLAKFLGYRFVPEQQMSIGSFSYSANPKIVIDQSSLGDYRFTVDNYVGGLSQEQAMAKIMGQKHVYQPKVYPYPMLEDLAGDGVRKIVDCLERFPELGGKPIFDHYGVIVPSVLYTESCFRDSNGLIQRFDDMNELSLVLDRSLIKTKSVIPVLVGERDNRCFFISYWI